MMRLPPPPVESDTHATLTPGVGSAATPPSTGLEVRVEATAGAGVTHGLGTSVAPRYTLAGLVRPIPTNGLRVGLAADLATGASIDQGSFHGSFQQWAILAAGSLAFERGILELAPYVAAGVEHVSYDGSDPQGAQSDGATVLTVRGGATARLRSGRWSIGVALGLELAPSTRTYTKAGSMAEIFEIPRFGVTGGLVAGVDLTP